MWFEYGLIAACFIILIVVRIFLFKKSYKNKLKYYTEPSDLALEIIQQNKRKNNNVSQQMYNIEKMLQLIQYNLLVSVQQVEQKEKCDYDDLAERLRNVAMYINIVKHLHKDQPPKLVDYMKQISNKISPQLDTFTTIKDMCKEKIEQKKGDLFLYKSIVRYIEVIIEDLTEYLFQN